jgi:kelch-like protein 8
MNYPRGGVAIATSKVGIAKIIPNVIVMVSVLQGFLYAIGGNDGATSLDSCERFDPHLNKWTMIATMKMKRAGAGAAEINGKIYVIGTTVVIPVGL